jgi:D-alanyl-D-alanine carboxypeptidase/D-alanyl-D-alanine-endopeptidase (penicillin-binding protein 4)
MRSRIGLSFVVILALELVAARGYAAPSREQDREALRRAMQTVIEQSPLKTARVSVQVKSLSDGAVIFSRDADELLNPASNVKLFTAAAALAKLGTEYRFETEFFTDDFKDGKAKSLGVRGKGDPSITTERLYGMVSELVHAGLKEVQDIVVDDSWFDEEQEAPGYDQEFGDKAYLAPTGALSLNWNTVGVYLRPNASAGTKAVAELEPASEYFLVDSSVTTGTSNQRHFTVSSALDKDKVHQRITMSGAVPLEKGAWWTWKKIDRPSLYFGYTLKALLVQRGVKIKGRVRKGDVPTSWRMMHVAQSDTLDIVLKKLNKNSSNFVAEQLIKTLGAEGRSVPGTTAKGIDVVEEFLEREVGLARGTYVMKNGSGLNDTNRFSAAQTNKLLSTMMSRFPLMPEFTSALGIAGKDGTLKHRFEGSDAVGRLRAKTGTLESVSALSGYVQSVGGESFVFSIVVNDFPGRAGTVLRHIDALGAAVAASGSVQGPDAAVAAMTQLPTVVGPFDALKMHLTTYVAMGRKSDRKNAPFLRTAWRSEKDPAVRALIAEALYLSDRPEPAGMRVLLDSAMATEDVYGRLRKAAREASIDVPVLPSLVELAGAGSVEAASRVMEFARAARGDELASAWISEHMVMIAHDAPMEFITALKMTKVDDQAAALDALAQGLVKAGQEVEAPLSAVLKKIQASPDAAMAEFSKEMELVLIRKISEARSPEAVSREPSAVIGPPASAVPAPSLAPSAPGG